MLNILLKLVFLLLILLLILLLSLSVFVIGFFIGYTRENKRLYKKATQGENEQNAIQKAKEEKAKREWKKFLSYDGSSNADVSNSK